MFTPSVSFSHKLRSLVVFTVSCLLMSSIQPLAASANSCSASVSNATSTVSQTTSGLCLLRIDATTAGAEFQVPSHVSNVSIVIIGGGGGGGAGAGNGWGGGGGGAAGQVIVTSSFPVTPGASISMQIGAGGTGGYSYNGAQSPSTRGATTSFGALQASGGLGGANHTGSSGGNGAGPTSRVVDGTVTSQAGGAGVAGSGSSGGGGGGGAGAGGNGVAGSSSQGGTGGTAFVETFSGDQLTLGGGGRGGGGVSGSNGFPDERNTIPATSGGGGVGSRGGSNTQAYGGSGNKGAILVFFAAAPVPAWTNGQVDSGNQTTSNLKVATDGNSIVTINGNNLGNVTAVTVNGQSASFSSVSSTRLTFHAPALSAGTYDLVITNPAGSLTKASYIQYLARPSVSADATLSGTAIASQSLTLNSSTWLNFNNKQWSWYRCDSAISTPQNFLPSDCVDTGAGSASTYELKAQDICKYVTVTEVVNNGGVYAPDRVISSSVQVLASASPWALVADSQNGDASNCSTSSATVPNATTKSGLVFKEWNSNPAGNGTAYSPGAALSLSGNLQLFAIYMQAPGASSGNSGSAKHTYMGPTIDPMPRLAVEPSRSYLFKGSRLDMVQSIFIDEIQTEIAVVSPSEIRISVPDSISAGIKDLVLFSSAGKLTIVAAVNVQMPTPVIEGGQDFEQIANPKVTIGTFDSRVAVYTRGYQDRRLSIKLNEAWVVVDPLAEDFTRTSRKFAPGTLLRVSVFIDRVMVTELEIIVE
jgi:Listeria-Bacteroides repeat domain (List_Bact_rpt)/IPT/TIG domain